MENRRGKGQRAVDAEGGTKEDRSSDRGACDDLKDAWGTMSLGLGGPLDAGRRGNVKEESWFLVQGSQWVGGGDRQGLCVLSCRGSERYKLCCYPAAGPMG